MASQNALQTLERSRLIQSTPGAGQDEYRFHHSLIQEVAYRSLLRQERRRLHGTVGQTLEDLFAHHPEEVASELAEHFRQAEDHERAFRYLLLAARQDMRVYAHQEALVHFDEAIAAGARSDIEADELLAIFLQRGRALELSGQHGRALQNYTTMEQRALELDRPRAELRARLQKAILYGTGSPVADPELGIDIARRTLEQAQQLGDAEAEARALWIILLVYQMRIDHLAEAVEAGEMALNLARTLEIPLLQGMIANDLGSAYINLGHVGEAGEILAEAREIMEQLDNQPMLANVLANQMLQRTVAGRYEQALAFSDEGYRVSERIGNLWGQACSLLFIDLVYAELGDYRQALEAGSQCLRLGNAAGFVGPSVIVNATQAWLRGHLGRHSEGLAHIESAPAKLIGPLLSIAGQLLSVKALLHLQLEQLTAAQQALDEAVRYTSVEGASLLHPSMLFVRLAQASLELARGHPAQVPKITTPTLAEMNKLDYRLLAPDFYLVTGKAQAADGELSVAAQTLDAGVTTADDIGSLRSLWQLLAARADLHDQLGEGERGDQYRQRARGLVRTIADNIAPLGLADSFLDQPRVQSLLES